MYRMIAVIVFFLFVGGILAFYMQQDPGYVYIHLNGTTYESSFWIALLFVVLSFVVFNIALILFTGSVRANLQAFNWLRHYRGQRQYARFSKGLLSIIAGDWRLALKQLKLKPSDNRELMVVSYLARARAAHEIGDRALSDEMITKAQNYDSNAEWEISMTLAQFQMSNKQWEQALANLLRLKKKSPSNQRILQLLTKVYRQLKDWPELVKLIPLLEKHEVFDAKHLSDITEQVYKSIFVNTRNSEQLNEVWKNLPTKFKKQANFLHLMAQQSIALGDTVLAEQRVREFLQKNWDDDLIIVLGWLKGANTQKQLLTAEHWLQQRPNSGALLLTLGRLSLLNQSWAKARTYFESSAKFSPTHEVYLELARLAWAQNELEHSGEYFTKSVKLGRPILPSLPLPTTK